MAIEDHFVILIKYTLKYAVAKRHQISKLLSNSSVKNVRREAKEDKSNVKNYKN